MALGGAIGYERELKNRPAGFRTHMLVAGAAALLVGLGELIVQDQVRTDELVQLDPIRLVEATIAGVAFIGAGTIFAARRGNTVSGITTAASLLMVAVIGIACGLGFGVAALGGTVLTLGVLVLLGWWERRRHQRLHERNPHPATKNPAGKGGVFDGTP